MNPEFQIKFPVHTHILRHRLHLSITETRSSQGIATAVVALGDANNNNPRGVINLAWNNRFRGRSLESLSRARECAHVDYSSSPRLPGSKTVTQFPSGL
ncbi:hypothetical protein RRG08_031111 [Elysia crispata]|uniref:Uncharacterized protein n=1 Tax=Elysia crispata TaxID=231223 RepID=A0AAE0ZF98_9GAST|nr:hypothetical protein RRG08_031111 [Elysia crispata]